MSAFAGWENFYVIVGSSAGALIGLQFVVLTLITSRPTMHPDAQLAGDAFASPSVVHFSVALLLSAILTAPWGGSGMISLVWAVVGVCGILYTVAVAWRLRVQTFYRPVFEDWLFHCILPFGTYVTLTAAAWVARSNESVALFLVGGSALSLLFIGIHNAWDSVTYHVFTSANERQGSQRHYKRAGKEGDTR